MPENLNMVLKILRGVWFVSSLGVLAVLLLVYAGLPEQVSLFQHDFKVVSVSLEGFFYLALATITLINALVYIIKMLFEKEEALRAWFHGLIITLNVFFVITLFFVSAYNTSERFDFERIGPLISASVILVAAWALFWPFRIVVRKFLTKPSV